MPSDPLLKIDDDVGQISAIAVQAEITLGSAITPVPILVGAREILATVGGGKQAAGSGCYDSALLSAD